MVMKRKFHFPDRMLPMINDNIYVFPQQLIYNEDKQDSLGCINLEESGNEILRMLHQKPFFKPNIQFISSN